MFIVQSPKTHVILSEQHEVLRSRRIRSFCGRRPLLSPFQGDKGMRILRRASLAQDDRCVRLCNKLKIDYRSNVTERVREVTKTAAPGTHCQRRLVAKLKFAPQY